MSWTRCLTAGALAAGIGLGSHVKAQEPPPSPPPKPAPAAPAAEPPKKKESFWGEHFAMYLETRGGPAGIKDVDNPTSTSAQLASDSTIGFENNKSGRFDIGWTLPRGRGQYILRFTGVADGDYKLDATGLQQGYDTGTPTPGPIGFLAPWWHVSVRNGNLETTQTPPFWNANTDDANHNGLPDPGELRYPTTLVDVTSMVPKDLGMQIQAWDLFYRREFGGVKIHSRWTAGLRYLDVRGALVTPSWLKSVQDIPTFGYSDGVINNFILMGQSNTGYGPVGSGEIQFRFFKQRLVLYAEGQAAFLVEKLKADSGSFTYFATNQGVGGLEVLPGLGHINRSVDKTAWNLGIEAGVRVRLLEGFNLIVDWNRTGYLDSILIPTQLSIPQNASQVSLGTTSLFISRDLVVSSLNLGLSFQF